MKLNKLSLAMCVALLAGLPVHAEHRPLLPQPQQVSYGNGSLPLQGLTIRFAMKPSKQDYFTGRQLASHFSDIQHRLIRIPTKHASGPELILNRTGDGADVPADHEHAGPDSREAYSITITEHGAEIRANSSAGLFYGVQTLLQMVEGQGDQAALPAATIHDWPALAYRGFMMDFSEGQLLRVSEIERQLDLLARFKANQYYFYSEMSIAWKGYEAVNPDGRYTQDQVRQVIDYARLRHIDVVPCVELYGHMHELFRVEEFAGLGLPRYGGEFDPRNPRMLAVIDDLFDQTTQLFPSAWCHVGFDEPWALGKIGTTPGKNPFDTFVGTLQHLTDRARQHGKRLLYWADINNGASTLSNHPELISRLPAGAIAAPWSYDAESNYTRYIEPLASNNMATMVTPAVWNWNEIFPDYHRSFVNLNGMVAAGKRFNTLGILNTGWTDCGQTLYRQSLAGLAFGAAAGWQSGPVDTNTFFNDYTTLTYAPAVAPEVAQALEELSQAEQLFEQVLDNATQHGFWGDPLQPEHLARLEKHQDSCRQARLLAESAEKHLSRAMFLTPTDPTLKSLMISARLFDYLGMKCLYAVEWAGYFRELHNNPDPKLVTLYIGIQINSQVNGMLADLMDGISELRAPYREAWLEESTPFRLESAMAHWDAETRYWSDTWGRVNHLLHSHKTGEPFPSIDVLRAKP